MHRHNNNSKDFNVQKYSVISTDFKTGEQQYYMNTDKARVVQSNIIGDHSLTSIKDNKKHSNNNRSHKDSLNDNCRNCAIDINYGNNMSAIIKVWIIILKVRRRALLMQLSTKCLINTFCSCRMTRSH